MDGIKTLSNNIVEVYKYGRLDLDINRISTEMIEGEQPNVETTTLTKNSAKYHHHNCSSKYKKRSVESAKIAYEKRKRKNPCRSSRPIHKTKKNPVDLGMGSSQCCICAVVEKDDDKNLHAAGMLHWNEKKTNYAHLKYVTEKLKEMASSVGRKSISNEQTCFQRCQM